MTHTTFFSATSLLGVAIVSLLAFSSTVYAQTTDAPLEVAAQDMSVTVDITRATPCTPYELDWDDGEEVVATDESEICIQVIDTQTLEHTYEESGEYTITLTLSGETYTEDVTLPAPAPTSFALSDVATITAVYVDPNKMMADEEYYIYTITLESGEVVSVQTAAFTTREYRDEQFAKAGYTGDVPALLELVSETSTDDTTDDSESENSGVYQQLVSALHELIARLQQLLAQ